MKRAFSRAILRKAIFRSTAAIALSLSLYAQRSVEVRQPLTALAQALTDRNPQAAMIPFDKTFDQRDDLEKDFKGLTDTYTITNELDVTEEEIDNGHATLTVHWVLTLGDVATNLTIHREEDLRVKLMEKKNKWVIVDLSPIKFFAPDASGSN